MKKQCPVITLAALLAVCSAHGQFATTINDTSTNPAPPGGTLNVIPQNDHGSPTVNVSHYALYPTVQVICPSSGDLSNPVAVATGYIAIVHGGIIDARRCTGATTWTNAVTITNANTVLLLPCASLVASQPLTIAAGVRNVAIHGCAYQGGSSTNGEIGGTVWVYNNGGPAFIVGDSSYTVNTVGFSIDNMAIITPTTGASSAAFYFYRTQEIRMEHMYVIGDNSTDLTAMTLDGTGNYTGGYFADIHFSGYGTTVLLTGHLSGSVTDDYANASTFVKIHIDCPTSGGSPITNTIGYAVAGGDGNTWVGGDVEGCYYMTLLEANATNNTLIGVRNENSTYQYAAQSGSSYNKVLSGGTFFTGRLTDAGTQNSFEDSFHRDWNQVNGDYYASQVDATLTNHFRLGVGNGNERGLLNEATTDAGNRWQWGLSDGTTGEQFYQVNDLNNSVNRISIGQFTPGSGSTNAQTAINAAGTGAVVLNGSANAGTGGVVIDGGGSSPSEVAAIDSGGNQTLFGSLHFFTSPANQWSWNCASTSVCALHNDAATTPANVFRAFPNAGTEIDSQGTSAVVMNNTSTGGTGGFVVYEGGANSSTAAMTVTGAGALSTASNAQFGGASGTGNVVMGNHLNQLATADFAGSCAMSGTATCTVSFQHSWTNQPACSAEPGFHESDSHWYTWATNVVTVHNNSNQTGTYYVVCAGNPN